MGSKSTAILTENNNEEIEEEVIDTPARSVNNQPLEEPFDQVLMNIDSINTDILDITRRMNMFIIALRNENVLTDASTEPENYPEDNPLVNECVVCFQSEKLLITGCRHIICRDCIGKTNNTCPMCREHIHKSLIKKKC